MQFLLLSSFLNSKCDIWMTRVVPRLLRSIDNQNCQVWRYVGERPNYLSLACNLIFIQVWHVYTLCRTWELSLDISNIICKEIQRCPKTSSKMGSNYWFECTRMKPSSRRSKWTYGWTNLESVWGNNGDMKFATLLKPVRPVARTGQTSLYCQKPREDRSDRYYTPVWLVCSPRVLIMHGIWV
jgi:hypothetical protein